MLLHYLVKYKRVTDVVGYLFCAPQCMARRTAVYSVGIGPTSWLALVYCQLLLVDAVSDWATTSELPLLVGRGSASQASNDE